LPQDDSSIRQHGDDVLSRRFHGHPIAGFLRPVGEIPQTHDAVNSARDHGPVRLLEIDDRAVLNCHLPPSPVASDIPDIKAMAAWKPRQNSGAIRAQERGRPEFVTEFMNLLTPRDEVPDMAVHQHQGVPAAQLHPGCIRTPALEVADGFAGFEHPDSNDAIVPPMRPVCRRG
jgi:hypothetical protein